METEYRSIKTNFNNKHWFIRLLIWARLGKIDKNNSNKLILYKYTVEVGFCLLGVLFIMLMAYLAYLVNRK